MSSLTKINGSEVQSYGVSATETALFFYRQSQALDQSPVLSLAARRLSWGAWVWGHLTVRTLRFLHSEMWGKSFATLVALAGAAPWRAVDISWICRTPALASACWLFKTSACGSDICAWASSTNGMAHLEHYKGKHDPWHSIFILRWRVFWWYARTALIITQLFLLGIYILIEIAFLFIYFSLTINDSYSLPFSKAFQTRHCFIFCHPFIHSKGCLKFFQTIKTRDNAGATCV